MDIIQKFGNAVSSMSLEDPGKARRLLLTGYRLQEKRLLFFSDKNSIDFFISSYNFLNRQYIPVYKGLTVFLISQIHRATEPYPVYLCSQSLYISL